MSHRRWVDNGTNITESGSVAADALAPAVGKWLDEYLADSFPEELAQLSAEVVRGVAEEKNLYRKFNQRQSKKRR